MSKILVLDDDDERLKIFRRNLIGHSVTLVKTAHEAIYELDRNGPFDTVCLDHDLGGLINVASGPGTGYEVAEWLSQNPDKQPTQIIIHSFNEPGRKRMMAALPNAIEYPGVWTKISG